MDHWAALGMFESGDNNRMVGRAGEIFRYQIRRELCKRQSIECLRRFGKRTTNHVRHAWPRLNALMAGRQMILNFTFFGMRPRKSIIHTPL
jgi:hypothetical protein